MEKNIIEKSCLYLVATPIGNLDDITFRAIKVLSECDFIAAEDTRTSSKLLGHYDISKPMISYQKFNLDKSGVEIISRLKNGETCALITDAGTPGISDPGEDIVKKCISNGIRVIPVPGACAAISALISSGFSTKNFFFEGFLGSQDSEIKEGLKRICDRTETTVIYEAPHRLRKTLNLMSEYYEPTRKIALCREITKLNEEIFYTTVSEAIEKYSETDPRGEFVIVISGAEKESCSDAFWYGMTLCEHVDYYVSKMNMQKMDAIKKAAKDRHIPKNDIYKAILEEKK